MYVILVCVSVYSLTGTTCMYMYMYMCTCMCTCTYMYMYVHVHCGCMCVVCVILCGIRNTLYSSARIVEEIMYNVHVHGISITVSRLHDECMG